MVTGSTSGIGLATASALVRSGAEVVVNGRDAGRSPTWSPAWPTRTGLSAGSPPWPRTSARPRARRV
ncbi:MAG TPA: hypothetical protein VHH15_05175 [Actinophytocola sp.]|nr:hypothetical protein [Actinophytocola sp.]